MIPGTSLIKFYVIVILYFVSTGVSYCIEYPGESLRGGEVLQRSAAAADAGV